MERKSNLRKVNSQKFRQMAKEGGSAPHVFIRIGLAFSIGIPKGKVGCTFL